MQTIAQPDDAVRSGPRAPFESPAGEAAYLAAYDALMQLWPVPSESCAC